ncbi:MAG: ATP-dependent Clp protease ATP-binding subunit, partial [Clostridia bacterium]|nr:ATP-dependent Clp protease ATP-binding subunit [Clostridia bacterium]
RGAIEAAVELSVKLIADRQLPDKAIDLLDESCALLRLSGGTEGGGVRARIEQAANEGDYELAKKLREEAASVVSGPAPELTAEDVCAAAAKRTGLDVSSFDSAERFAKTEKELLSKVFGQDEAIAEICALLRRSAAGLGDPSRPFASFVLAGPAHSGKKTIVGRLAETAFNNSVVRLNGAEYSDDFSVNRLIGVPTGLSDEKGGLLTEYVRLHPVSVIVVSNAESCSPKLMNILSGSLVSGVIDDASGRSHSLRNCVIALITDTDASRAVGFASGHVSRGAALSSKLPASLTSLADIVVFTKELDEAALRSVIGSLLGALKERAARKRISLSFDRDAEENIFAASCGSAAKAERHISVFVEGALSTALLEAEISPGDTAVCSFENGAYKFRKVGQ